MSKKSKRIKRKAFSETGEDRHHICFSGRSWSQGWAKVLREHPYCKVYIPMKTLHRRIHDFVIEVPCPDGRHCKIAVEALNSWLEAGFISMDDRLDRRATVLSMCFKKTCPEAAKAFLKQQEIAAKFYEPS